MLPRAALPNVPVRPEPRSDAAPRVVAIGGGTGLPNVLRVEGHANHLPVTPGGQWPSNWELSAYRATTVLRYLASDGLPEARMYAAGYGSTQPLVPATDPTAISVNRRVDIVVLSTASAEANALLPSIDAAQGATP